jgi:uncharacterized protein
MAVAPPNPCLSCGACCSLFRVSFYWREIDEFTPGGVPTHLTEQLNAHRVMMQGTGGSSPRCAALVGEPGNAVTCTIHQSRPSVCRAFVASHSEGRHEERCDSARARFGLPPLTPADWISPDQHPDDDRPPEPLTPAA